jgi:hypothetical protein
MTGNLESRLTKVQRELLEVKEQEKAAGCICDAFVGIGTGRVEEFRAEMNRPCPTHGFRKLKILHFVETRPAGSDRFSGCEIAADPEVDELLKEYKLRLANAKRTA